MHVTDDPPGGRLDAMTTETVLITGASSGFGQMIAERLARAGHTVHASMREIAGRNAPRAREYAEVSAREGIDLRAVEMDVQLQDSVDAAVRAVLDASGQIDVLIHNAGHMVYGPAEAFTPEQLGQLYDVNVLGTQRVNRAVLPHMRARRGGLVVWVSSSSCAGGTPPYLAPYFAAKNGMDALAVGYARELARWGIETSIIVPGAFTTGTNHFAHAGAPADQEVIDAYEAGPYQGFGPRVQDAFNSIVPPDADPAAVATAVVDVVTAPFGTRPFRVHIDPSRDGADVGFAVLDRLKAEMLYRVGLGDLLRPTPQGAN
jgi:NAD(P)-dependent dehydrogenase (short-subunit alcohol dehydrogenase family)